MSVLTATQCWQATAVLTQPMACNRRSRAEGAHD